MRYFLSKDKRPKLILKANNTDLMERWVLHNAGYFMKNELGNSTTAFIQTKSGDEKLRKTNAGGTELWFLKMIITSTTYTTPSINGFRISFMEQQLHL